MFRKLGEKEPAKRRAIKMKKFLPERAAKIDPHNLGTILSSYTSLLQITEATTPSKKKSNSIYWTNTSTKSQRAATAAGGRFALSGRAALAFGPQ